MYPERWPEIEDLFERALERSRSERRAFLDQACGDDRALHEEVSALLAAHEEAGAFMTGPTVDDKAAVAVLDEVWVGRQLGPYRVLRAIGHGGMSTVYLGARVDDEYETEVAIKVVRPGPGVTDLPGRFLRERQILADLDHPNIADLHDGGTTEEGVPYFVMELIDGATILDYCDQENLTISARSELFLEVCGAVEAAHRNLIVHRDIKPANILVNRDGVPKLLDFGIAKSLDPEATQSLETTHDGRRLMTPAYASPEQIRGDTITTAADVYALGVVLYELLTGAHPHRLRGDTPRDVEDSILRRQTPRPSAVVRQATSAATTGGGSRDRPDPEEISRRRGFTARQLAHRLTGDLDNIVTMAMRKDPKRRYGSVEQLSEDLRRYRDGLPVLARKSSLSYRAGKFVRRNRWAVVAAATLAILILGFGIAMAFLAAQIARERDLVQAANQRENQLATRLADLAQNLSQALDDLQAEESRRVNAEADKLALEGKNEEAERLREDVQRARDDLQGQARALAELRGALAASEARDDHTSAGSIPGASVTRAQLQEAEQRAASALARAAEAETERQALALSLEVARNKARELEQEVAVAAEPSPQAAACEPGEEVEDQGIFFVRVCAGTFTMGSDDDDSSAFENEKPDHEVTLSEFWLGKYEITNEQYRRFRDDHAGEASYPATRVRWNQAKKFCEHYGFRLVTEAEWEYAARAGSRTRWSFGDDEGALGRFAWYAENSADEPHPVGHMEPNPWGLYDLYGNVWEWVADVWGPYSPESQVDPKGLHPALAPRPSHALRGGAFDSKPRDMRSALRAEGRPGLRSRGIGFRCVRQSSGGL